jgi:transcriptional regulator with XRE-family HTH domain
MTLGERIRDLRSAAGWSQESFADHCGLHRTAIGLYERGERDPKLSTLRTIAKGLNITVSELLDGLEK